MRAQLAHPTLVVLALSLSGCIANASADADTLEAPGKRMSGEVAVKHALDPGVNSVLQEAQEQLAYRRYHAAEGLLEKAALANPNNAQVHLLLGHALLRLDDPRGAEREYKLCFMLEPFGKFAAQAKQGMSNAVGLTVKEERPVIDQPQVMKRSVAHIDRQMRDAVNDRLTAGRILANQRVRDGHIRLKKIEQRGNAEMADWYHSPRRVGAADFLAWRGGFNEISNRTRIAGSYAAADGAAHANRALADATARAASIQESANNLYRLLAAKRKDGGPNLRAYGTGLYVRYYGHEDPTAIEVSDDPLLELKATAQQAPPGWFKRPRLKTRNLSL